MRAEGLAFPVLWPARSLATDGACLSVEFMSLFSSFPKTRRKKKQKEKGFLWSVRPESQQGEKELPIITKNVAVIAQLTLNTSVLFGASLFCALSSRERVSWAEVVTAEMQR